VAFPANRFEYNVLSWLIHARQRYGQRYLLGSDWTSLRWLLTDTVQQRPGRHVIEENVALVAATGGRCGDDSGRQIDIRLGPVAGRFHRYADRVLTGTHGPLLGVHTGCSVYKAMSHKRWPKEKFAELCARAREQLSLQPVLLGGAEESEVNRWIAQRCGALVAEPTSIRETAAIIQRCTLFVSNDSGLAHIASALDVPVVMIVGPTDQQLARPYTPQGRVVSLDLPCSPCFAYSRRPLRCRRAGDEAYACVRRLGVGRVLETVAQVLEEMKLQPAGDTPGAATHNAARKIPAGPEALAT